MKHALRFRIIAMAAALLLLPTAAHAAVFHSGDQVNLPAGVTIADDVYAAGGNVNGSGAIEGDLFAAGGNVLISGTVTGDLMAGAGTVIVLGSVGDDLRVGAGNIVIQGTVGGDVLAAGGQINISGAGIGGDVILGGGVVTIDAPIGGDLKLGGGQVTINAPVGGNVEIEADKITLGANAVIDGDLTYRSPQEAVIAEGAVVRGETVFQERQPAPDASAGIAALVSLIFIAKFLSLLIAALLIGLFFRRYATELVALVVSQPLREVGRGIIFAIVTPVLGVLLLATIIGIPLGILALLAFIGAMIFASIFAAIITGVIIHGWIWKPETPQISWKTILLGVFVYSLLSLVPFIGWIVQLGLILVSFGALVKIKLTIAKEWR